jgi:simple sugar transport system permease protein
VEQIPIIGFLAQVFLEQNIIVYIAIIVLIAMQIMLFRTRLGLRIRAVGEHPQAADTAGINVYALRYGAVIASGILSGLAGAFLSIGVGDTFIDGMTSGRGYIALAAMIFGKWTPIGAFIGCLIFGLGTSIAASNSTLSISQYVLEMVPYILTLVVLAGLVGRSVAPAADGVPYEPGGE